MADWDPNDSDKKIARDFFRRLYMLPYSYWDQMRLDPHAAKAEYLTAAHSEMLKPYRMDDVDFQGMEYWGPGVPGYEFPKLPDEWPDPYGDDDEDVGGRYVFTCSAASACWCPGETHCFQLDCNHTVYGVSLTWPSLDAADFKVTGGGDMICITAKETATSFHGMDVFMIAVDGSTRVEGEYSSLGISQCTVSECCDEHLEEHGTLSIDELNSGSSIGPNGSVVVEIDGGMGPYKWSISGSGFYLNQAFTATERYTWDRYVTVYGNSASGTGTLTVEGACGGSVTWYILSTDGNWVEICSDTDNGLANVIYQATCTETSEKYKYETVWGCVRDSYLAGYDDTFDCTTCDTDPCDNPEPAVPDDCCCIFDHDGDGVCDGYYGGTNPYQNRLKITAKTYEWQ